MVRLNTNSPVVFAVGDMDGAGLGFLVVGTNDGFTVGESDVGRDVGIGDGLLVGYILG